jgi:hypothetical protein
MIKNIISSIFIFPALLLLCIGVPIKFGLKTSIEGAEQLIKALNQYLDDHPFNYS